MNLSEQTILITGATSGIGLATAKACAAAGARIIITGRREEKLHAIAKQLGERCLALTLDVRDREAVFAAFANLLPEFATITALINNAGLALGLEPVPHINLEHWEQMVDTNIKGVLYCTQAVVLIMQRGGRGHIVNLGSTAGSYAYKGGNAYCATKAFIHQFSACLRADFLGQHIRVTTIAPAMTDGTEFADIRFEGDSSKAQGVYAGVEPLHAPDIAEAILWALSRPAHVNINHMEIMPIMQAPAGLTVHREALNL